MLLSVWSSVHPAVYPSKKFHQHGLIDPYMYSKTCPVPCWRCKGTFVIGKILGCVNAGQLTSAVRCVCGVWLAGIIVPPDSKCMIFLQFWQKQLKTTCTPSTSGMVMLAGHLHSAQLMEEQRDGLCRNHQQQQPQVLLFSRVLVWMEHSSKHLRYKWVIASHQYLAPKAKSWQAQESWMRFSRKCLSGLGCSTERLQRSGLKGHAVAALWPRQPVFSQAVQEQCPSPAVSAQTSWRGTERHRDVLHFFGCMLGMRFS